MMAGGVLDSADVTLDASGNGEVSLGPYGTVTWHVVASSINTTSPGAGSIPQCVLYQGAKRIDIAYDGSADSCDIPYDLTPSMKAKAVWTGGNPGDVATLTLIGTEVS